jgi:signal peptide peptidase SppA
MAHKLSRLIAEKINNKPLLITEDSLRPVLDYLETREEAAVSNDSSERFNAPSITDNIALIPVSGSLSYEKTFLGALCGLTSYQQLLEDVEEALSFGVQYLVLDVDSGGGEAYACFDTANAIRNRADKAGAKIIAYVDGMAASAAYALTSIADEVISHPNSESGSIGVLIRLIDQSEAMKKAGYKQQFITSADSKVPFNAEGGFKQEFIDDLQARVNALHIEFAEHVSKYRNISVESINDMKAKVFSANKAVELGLVDSIMTHDQFAEYLAQLEESKQPMPLNFSLFKKNTKASADVSQEVVEATVEQQEAALAALPEENVDMAEQALIQELQAKMDALQTQYDADVAEALAALDEKDAELNAALKELDSIKAAQAQEALDAKKAKLVAVVGTEMAEDLFADLSALPDAAFDKVVASYQSANAKFEKSELANEVGYEADGSADAEQKESALARRLKAKQAKPQ